MDPNKQTGGVELDMDAINAAVDATAGQDPNIQNTFDVDKISLDDTPMTNDELQKQLADNPNMSLAGEDKPAEATTQLETPVSVNEASVAQADAQPTIDEAPAAQENGSLASAEAPAIQEGSDNSFAATVEAPAQKEDESFTVDSESSQGAASAAINNVGAKAQDNAKKALEAMRPKSNTGIIVLTVVGAIILLVAIVAAIVLL